jgi:hypothetical protein
MFQSLLWWAAYYGGTASVVMTINTYGEMMPEFYMWFLLIPIMVYGFWLNLKEIF